MDSDAVNLEALKKEAALRAVALVQSGQRVGLGTGSTAKYAIEELGRKLAAGELSGIVGVSTSEASEKLAREVGLPTEPLDPRPLDIAIDGDKLVRTIEISGPILASEDKDVVREIAFSKFNEPVEIEQPNVS